MLIRLIEFITYALPVRYWFHCRRSQEPLPYAEWRGLMLRCHYTTWHALTNYRWWRFWRWTIFSRWFWAGVRVAISNRAELLGAIRTYRHIGDV